MSQTRRWLSVLAVIAVLLCLPAVVSALPVTQSNITAAQLLVRITRSGSIDYSGYAESNGGLSLPITQQYTAVSDLLGGQTQMRVWSRGARDWRVDAITVAGETDTYIDSFGSWSWNYESNQAVRSAGSTNQLRLPLSGDLLPSSLGVRLLSQATASEVTRLRSRRIAGRDAAGLRLVPSASAQSTIDRVEVWADSTGVPLRVVVYAKGTATATVTTAFLQFSPQTPAADVTRFEPANGVRLRDSTQPDIASAVDRFGLLVPPASLGGLRRNTELQSLSKVGVYGQGVTEFVAIALPNNTADSLRKQLAKVPGITQTETDAAQTDTNLKTTAGSIGPLSLILGPDLRRRIAWLVVGTVTPATLATALAQLPTTFRRPS